MTIGVVGTGRIGVAVMDRLLGFGCRVLAYDRCRTASVEYVQLGALLQESDVVTLHVPLTSETHHLLDRRRIEQMRHSAFVVNTARGSLLDTEALLAALESGRLGGAALDVVEGEEGVFYADHRKGHIRNEPLWQLQQLPNVLITPHTAYYTDHSLSDMVENSLTNCLRFERRAQWSRLKLAIVFGGCSEEHPVSVKSAQEVAHAPRSQEVRAVLHRDHKERRLESLCNPHPGWEAGNCRAAMLSPDRTVHGLLVREQERHETIHMDVVLPVLHGRLGEDGAMQGLLELSGIPYVGCDVQSSALCMDKSLAYMAASSAGIATPTFWTVRADEDIDLDSLTYPVFVKPARSGSSFGVSHVSRADELPIAVEDRKKVRHEGVDRRGRRRNRGRMRNVREGRGDHCRRHRPNCAFTWFLQNPSGGGSRKGF